MQRAPALYESFGLGPGHFRKSGSLVVAYTEDEVARLAAVLQAHVGAGDTDARMVGQGELRELEPALSHAALGAVLCPHEVVVEPWLIPLGYVCRAKRRAALFHARSSVWPRCSSGRSTLPSCPSGRMCAHAHMCVCVCVCVCSLA